MTPRDPKAGTRELLHELCVDLGFCLPPQEQRRLQEAPPADAESFTDAVFAAEGMDPGLHPHLWRRVRNRIARRPAADTATARQGADALGEGSDSVLARRRGE